MIGRGGKRGTTAGRGTKGQKARAGHRIRPEIRDLIKKLPKRRGHRAPAAGAKPVVLNLGTLASRFKAGLDVTPLTLAAAGLIKRRSGRLPPLKLLGTGTINRPLVVTGLAVSASARQKIEAAGGKIMAV